MSDYHTAIEIFNKNPKDGMNLLLDGGFVENSTSAIVKFLLSKSELNKSAIGVYIGDINPYNVQVRNEFINSMNFTDMELVPALRLFLQSCRMPNEAQQIDRILEAFADHYWKTNPNLYTNPDTVYTLTFSIIILSENLHSERNKHKMDVNAFIKNSCVVKDGNNPSPELLQSIFEDVKSNQIIL
ncbi:Sec7 domain-containing protein [Globomyces pollinis-pini]|nr:Sec7 domain-containing protein [Globomyces pollinis-pini]